ncbi:MAG: type II toxin-antitoxin system RelE/ParE family toxin [Candidatus Hydrogenedentota bacterium]
MPLRIRITPAALDEIDGITRYIGSLNAEAASRFYDAIDSALQTLADAPRIGSVRRFRNRRIGELRMWPIQEFPDRLIFYRVSEDVLEIVHVLHSAQDYRRQLGPESE